jgi:hypothetical protein
MFAFRLLVLVLILLVSPVARPAESPVPTLLDQAVRADPAGERSMQRLALRRKLRGARYTAWVGLSMVLTSPWLIRDAREPGNYDFRGPWYDKAEYDRTYQVRRVTSPLARTGLVLLGGLGLPTLGTGVVLEMLELSRFSPLSTHAGWVGSGLMAAGLVLMPFATIEPTVVPWVSIGLASAGVVVSAAQLGLNIRASRRLPRRQREELYLPLPAHRVKVSLAPAPLPGGAGVVVVGLW